MAELRARWVPAAWHALPVTAMVLALFFYWYAVANRSIVFLYDHDMGPRFVDTGPFSAVTRSRYWMAGLVAGGAVLAAYSAALFVLGRVRPGYRPPAWPRVWLLCALPLTAGILAITMTRNAPVLPAVDALAVTMATLVALGPALAPGALAARAPLRLMGLAVEGLGVAAIADGVAFAPRLMLFMPRGLAAAPLLVVLGPAAGASVVLAVALLRRRRGIPAPPLWLSLLAGLCWAYLLGPLAHFLVGTDGWFYITTADNFFPGGWLPLAAGWLVALVLAAALRRIARGRRASSD